MNERVMINEWKLNVLNVQKAHSESLPLKRLDNRLCQLTINIGILAPLSLKSETSGIPANRVPVDIFFPLNLGADKEEGGVEEAYANDFV